MRYEIEIIYDDEFKELLAEENIHYCTIQRVVQKFICEKLECKKVNKSNVLIPFVNPENQNRYSLYGNMIFIGNTCQFNVELLGISIKPKKF